MTTDLELLDDDDDLFADFLDCPTCDGDGFVIDAAGNEKGCARCDACGELDSDDPLVRQRYREYRDAMRAEAEERFGPIDWHADRPA
jgi:hypothetical protein